MNPPIVTLYNESDHLGIIHNSWRISGSNKEKGTGTICIHIMITYATDEAGCS